MGNSLKSRCQFAIENLIQTKEKKEKENMLPDSEKRENNSPAKAGTELEHGDDLELHVDEWVDQIVHLAKDKKKTNEDCVSESYDKDENIDVVGPWEDVDTDIDIEEFIERHDCIGNSNDRLDNNKCRPSPEASQKKKITSDYIDSSNKQSEIVHRKPETFSEYFDKQNASETLVQKVPFDETDGRASRCTSDYDYHQLSFSEKINATDTKSSSPTHAKGHDASTEDSLKMNGIWSEDDFSLRVSDVSVNGSNSISLKFNTSDANGMPKQNIRDSSTRSVDLSVCCLATKSRTGTSKSVTITNTFSMDAKVVLERLSDSIVKSKIPLTIKGFMARTSKKGRVQKPYSCSDCCFKTSRRRTMFFHLEETNHEFVHHKKQVISKGDFYFLKSQKIRNYCKTKPDKLYQLRRSYKKYSCPFNECTFSAYTWQVMYNHAKFIHLQKPNSGLFNSGNNNIPKDVSKPGIRPLVMLERLPATIVNYAKTPVPIGQWLPYYSSNIELKVENIRESRFQSSQYAAKFLYFARHHKRRVISTAKKFSCTFKKCMFVTASWKTMYHHVKFCHIPSSESCVVCLKRVLEWK